jgi:hypothetical protein
MIEGGNTFGLDSLDQAVPAFSVSSHATLLLLHRMNG